MIANWKEIPYENNRTMTSYSSQKTIEKSWMSDSELQIIQVINKYLGDRLMKESMNAIGTINKEVIFQNSVKEVAHLTQLT